MLLRLLHVISGRTNVFTAGGPARFGKIESGVPDLADDLPVVEPIEYPVAADQDEIEMRFNFEASYFRI